MGDEAQRLIQQARVRVFERMVREGQCQASPSGGATGRLTLPARPSQPQSVHVPVEQMLPMSPPRPSDPVVMENLRQVYQRSLNPVPLVPPQPPPKPYGPGYQGMDPTLMSQIESFDPYADQGAVARIEHISPSYYDQLSDIREKVDTTGGAEAMIGRARQKAFERLGKGRELPLYAPPCPAGTALPESEDEEEGPPLDEVLSAISDSEGEELRRPEVEDDDEWKTSPPWELDNDDFLMPETPDKMTYKSRLSSQNYRQQERRRLEDVRRISQRFEMLKQRQVGRMEEEEGDEDDEAEEVEQQVAPQCRLPAAASRPLPVPSRASAAPSRASAVPSRASAGPSRTSAGPPRLSTGPTRRSAGPTRGPVGPCRSKKSFAERLEEEKKAKVADKLAATKKRMAYQAPRLKSRPPTKPPTKPKAPRGLDERGPERRKGPDPTRDFADDLFDSGYDISPQPPDCMSQYHPRQLPIITSPYGSPSSFESDYLMERNQDWKQGYESDEGTQFQLDDCPR